MAENTQVAFKEFNRKQHIFIYYTFAVLIDLTVLGFFAQYSEYVYIDNFTTTFLVAILLQVLLQITVKVEHYVAEYFKKKDSLSAKIMRGVATWAILFVSKLIILKAIDIIFGDKIVFSGMFHGLVMFIIVVVTIIVAEQVIVKINNLLGDK